MLTIMANSGSECCPRLAVLEDEDDRSPCIVGFRISMIGRCRPNRDGEGAADDDSPRCDGMEASDRQLDDPLPEPLLLLLLKLLALLL